MGMQWNSELVGRFRSRLKSSVTILVFAPMGLVACGSTSSVDSGEESPSPSATLSASPGVKSTCSNGPAYDSATEFPQLDQSASIPERECVARCGDTSLAYWGAGGGPSPTVSALPTGSCNSEEPCAMKAVRLFCQPPSDSSSARGALMQFVCRCSDREWRCSGSYLGGGAGVYPPCPDAGGPPDGG